MNQVLDLPRVRAVAPAKEIMDEKKRGSTTKERPPIAKRDQWDMGHQIPHVQPLNLDEWHKEMEAMRDPDYIAQTREFIEQNVSKRKGLKNKQAEDDMMDADKFDEGYLQ